MGTRRRTPLCLLTVLLPAAVVAQAPLIRSPDVTRDFAVPDAPAFLLVTPDPGSILRPQTTRDLGVVLSQFRTPSGSFALPRAVAVEFSPVILLRADYADATYRRFLSSLRLSAASRRDTAPGSPTDLAFGVRASIKDDAIYRERVGDAQLTRYLTPIQRIASDADDRTPEGGELVLTVDEQQRIQELREFIRRRWSELYWNADVIDIALAVGARTRDSTGVDPEVRQVSIWGTYAKGWGDWGQMLLGVRAGWRKDSATAPSRQSLALGVRLYAGRNGQKAFLEAEDQVLESGRATVRLGAGVELSLATWAWFTASFVHENTGAGPARTYTTFRLNTGLPGL